MKNLQFTALSILLALGFNSNAMAGDEKITADKARDMVDKLLGEVQKAAGKVETKSKELWAHTKESMQLSKEEYLKRATSGLATMDAEVQVLAESGSGVTTRDYFKMRIESLKLHVQYLRRDLERLKDTPNEETFRVKQKGFDRTMGFLGDSIGIAKEEAGL